MARAINKSMEHRLLNGIYNKILVEVKKDHDLNLEVRTSSKIIIYYKKTKILTLFSRREDPELLSKGYWKNQSVLKFDISRPGKYFQEAKKLVDKYKIIKSNKEFGIQQKISIDNKETRNRYWIIDMEYQFAQNIIKNRTNKNTRFDLVGIDLKESKIVLMELKQGQDSSKGVSGINDHVEKFEEHIAHEDFRKWLRVDVKSIIKTKVKLGLFNSNILNFITNIEKMCIDFVVVFAYQNIAERSQYLDNFPEVETIFIDINKDKLILN